MHLQVLLQGGLVSVGLPALTTEEDLLLGVDQLMSLQVTGPTKALATV